MQELVGQRVSRFGLSHNSNRFFFDVPAKRINSRRSRYGYELADGLLLVGSHNIAPLLGGLVLAVYATDSVPGSLNQLVFETNPTTNKVERTIFYIEQAPVTDSDFLIVEDDSSSDQFLLTEGLDFLILDGSGDGVSDATIQDASINKNIFSPTDSETKFFIIQEDDF
jgi:hypothetical protein